MLDGATASALVIAAGVGEMTLAASLVVAFDRSGSVTFAAVLLAGSLVQLWAFVLLCRCGARASGAARASDSAWAPVASDGGGLELSRRRDAKDGSSPGRPDSLLPRDSLGDDDGEFEEVAL